MTHYTLKTWWADHAGQVAVRLTPAYRDIYPGHSELPCGNDQVEVVDIRFEESC